MYSRPPSRFRRFPSKQRKPGKPELVRSVLNLALKHQGLEQSIARYKFILNWEEIVGKEIAARTKPECINGSSLVVRVCNSVWAQELSFQKGVILKRLEKYMDQSQVVNDIIFCVAGD